MKLKIALSIIMVILAATAIVNAALLVFKEVSLPKNTTTYVNKETSHSTDSNGVVKLLGDERGGGWP